MQAYALADKQDQQRQQEMDRNAFLIDERKEELLHDVEDFASAIGEQNVDRLLIKVHELANHTSPVIRLTVAEEIYQLANEIIDKTARSDVKNS